MGAFPIEPAERCFLGEIDAFQTFTTGPAFLLGSSPATPPAVVAAGSQPLNVLENKHVLSIPPTAPDTLGSEEVRQERFHIVEVEVQFTSAGQCDVICWASRVNPTPNKSYDNGADSAADSWGTAGKQTAYSDPTVTGGNRLRFAVGTAKWLCFQAFNPTGSPLKLFAYGIVERRGGIS